jgi:hypothetical protein
MEICGLMMIFPNKAPMKNKITGSKRTSIQPQTSCRFPVHNNFSLQF